MFKLRQKCNRRNAMRKTLHMTELKNTRPLAMTARDTTD